MYSTKIIYSSPFITEAMAKRISDKVFGLSYMPANIHWRGNPAHQAGDALRIIDRSGETHTVLIMSQTIRFGGGLSSQISCPGETGEEVDGMMTTPTGQQIKNAVDQIDADIKQYVAEVCKLTLQEANKHTNDIFGSIINGNEVAW